MQANLARNLYLAGLISGISCSEQASFPSANQTSSSPQQQIYAQPKIEEKPTIDTLVGIPGQPFGLPAPKGGITRATPHYYYQISFVINHDDGRETLCTYEGDGERNDPNYDSRLLAVIADAYEHKHQITVRGSLKDGVLYFNDVSARVIGY